MAKYILYCSTGDHVSRTPKEKDEYVDKMAKKIADKLKINVVGILVTGSQNTYLERVD